MKKRALLGTILLIAIMSISCSNADKSKTGDPVPIAKTKGSMTLNLAKATVSRTIAPDLNIASYTITGNGPDGATFTQSNISTTTVTITDLVVGSWTITVQALNTDGIAIATGSTTVSITTGQTATATITVQAIDGLGTLNVTMSWPSGLLPSPSIVATLAPVDDASNKTPLNFVISGDSAAYTNSTLEDGWYRLNIELNQNSATVWRSGTEIVRIAANVISAKSYALGAGEIYQQTGGLDVTIIDGTAQPITITFAGQKDTLLSGNAMTVTATTSEAVTSYQWELNDTVLTGETSNSITIGSTLVPGRYQLTLIVSNGGVYSSLGFSFCVFEATSDTQKPVPGDSGTITASNILESAITLNWSRATDDLSVQSELRYKVVRSLSDDIATVEDAETNGTVVQDWTPDIDSFTVTGLTSETTYYFTVLVRDEAGNKSAYTMHSETTIIVYPPIPDGNGILSPIQVRQSSFAFSWLKATDSVTPQEELHYKVVYSLSANIATVADAEANGIVSQDWEQNIDMRELVNLTSDTNYYYNVLVKNTAGHKSSYVMGSVTTPPVPYNPEIIQTDGSIKTMAVDNNILYLGGNFSILGQKINAGHGTIIDMTTGDLPASSVHSETDGNIYAVIPDGHGGWYIGGDFSTVRGISRNNIARINADGSLHDWNPDASGIVYALLLHGTNVYAGGDFMSIGGEARSKLAAINTITARATSWNPNANDSVYTFGLYNSTLYVGGKFTSINGETRNRTAAFDITSGSITAWDAYANSTVRAIAASGTAVYIGGDFTRLGGQDRNYLASVGTYSGLANGWYPYSNSSVNALIINGSRIYAAGNFTSIGGQTRNRIASLDILSAAIHSWDPNADSKINTLALSGSTIYAGGTFTTIGGKQRNYIAALDTTTGTATSWNPQTNGEICALTANGSAVYIGGKFNYTGGQLRRNIAAYDLSSQTITAWNPEASLTVETIIINNSTVYIGGSFSSVGGQSRNRIAAINKTTGTVTDWNPNCSNSVYTIFVDGSTVYIGGSFTTVGGIARNRIAAIDATSGSVTSWNPNANNTVSTLVKNGSAIYTGGLFTSIGGQTRSRIAALDATTGTATAWNPSANNFVSDLLINGSTLYVSGGFTSIGSQTRSYLAALDISSGTATSWNPNPDSSISDFIFDGSTVYVSGSFTTIGGATRPNIAALDLTSGLATSWTPLVDYTYPICLALDSTKVYVGKQYSVEMYER